MKKQQVINLDPIDRKKKKGYLARLFITRWSGGRSVNKMHPYGHYMFCGSQGSGKTASVLWYAEKLIRKHRKRFDITLYSNIGVGTPVEKTEIFDLISNFNIDDHSLRIVILDEVHTYFPRGSSDKETRLIRDRLVSIFSQLRKRNTYILSTAQVYGRLDKSLREQCLYMISCSVTMSNRLKNEFIKGDDIICDDLGRWAGDPERIYVHGMSKLKYDTRLIVSK